MAIFLNCGTLKSNTCTIENYKIEWRLNSRDGAVVLISGIGNDPEIQAQHPIVKEIVPTGDLYPVIIYVYVNNEKVTSEYEIDALFSPGLKDCLPFITIDEINCSTTSDPDNVYDIVVNYNNVSDVALNKSRTLNYFIGNNTNYFAWRFKTALIADQIKIYYCTAIDSVGTLLDNYIVGSQSSPNVYLSTNLTPVDYPNNPKIYSITPYPAVFFKQITDLTSFSYTNGDYLRIEIIGSPLDPTNNNTNWEVSFKCLETLDTSTFNTRVFGEIDLTSTPNMTYDSVACRYTLEYKTKESAYDTNQNSATTIDLLKYLTIEGRYFSETIGTLYIVDMFTDKGNCIVKRSISYTLNVVSNPEWICRDLPAGDQIRYNKTVGNLEITYPNINEYNAAVSDINAISNDSDWINATASDPTTNVDYYSYWTIIINKSASCGDVSQNVTERIHHTSVITYDPTNFKINFTTPIISNQYVATGENCDYRALHVGTIVQQCILTANRVGDDYVTTSTTHTVGARRISTKIEGTNIWKSSMYYQIRDKLHEHILSPADLINFGFIYQNPFWVLYKQHDRVTFTLPDTHSDRMANWTLERKIGLRTGVPADFSGNENYELIYQSGITTTTTTTTTP